MIHADTAIRKLPSDVNPPIPASGSRAKKIKKAQHGSSTNDTETEICPGFAVSFRKDWGYWIQSLAFESSRALSNT